jgi:hypothetical protein
MTCSSNQAIVANEPLQPPSGAATATAISTEQLPLAAERQLVELNR